MKKLLYILFMGITALSCSNHALAEEGNDGGGGYAYYYTVIPVIKDNIKELSSLLSTIDQNDLNQVLVKYSNGQNRPVDKNILAKIIASTVMSPAAYKTKNNPGGTLDLLIMDYNLKENYIEALHPFFELFALQTYSNKQIGGFSDRRTEFNRLLVHEALHLFGYGVKKDIEAYNMSIEILSLIQYGNKNCGLVGTLKEREADCKLVHQNDRIYSMSDLLPIVSEKYGTGTALDESHYKVKRTHNYYVAWSHVFTSDSRKTEKDKEGQRILHACDNLPTLDGQLQWRLPSFDEAVEIVNYTKEVDPWLLNPKNPDRLVIKWIPYDMFWTKDFRIVQWENNDENSDPSQGYAKERTPSTFEGIRFSFTELQEAVGVLCISK